MLFINYYFTINKSQYKPRVNLGCLITVLKIKLG